MLVLKRKRSESIVLFDGDRPPIVITITESGPGYVRVGVDAPRKVSIVRKELLSSAQLSEVDRCIRERKEKQ